MRERFQSREKEAVWLPSYGRKQMLMAADCYRELAGSLTKTAEEVSERSADRSEYLYKKQLSKNRIVMAERMREMSDHMRRLAEENLTYRVPKKKQFKTLVSHLRKHGIVLKEILITQQVRTTVYVTMRGLRNADYTTEDIAFVLSESLGISVLSAKENLFFVAYEPDCYIYESAPKYTLIPGMAKATKEGETISGDNYSFYEPSASKRMSIISDGAGSGVEACKDSEQVLEWVEKYLDTGFSARETADMVNGLFYAEGREQNMPTLDICTVDLDTAKASFVKYGSADSFIISKDKIVKIRNVGFPLGFCNSEENSSEENILLGVQEGRIGQTEYQLEDGDIIVMFTDGISDAIEDEDAFLEILSLAEYRNAAELANYILNIIVHQNQGRIRDDMTVLVTELSAV